MRYKGMVARYEYIVGVQAYIGEIVNCPDVISFSALTFKDLESVMHVAVDSYLAYHKEKLSGAQPADLKMLAPTSDNITPKS